MKRSDGLWRFASARCCHIVQKLLFTAVSVNSSRICFDRTGHLTERVESPLKLPLTASSRSLPDKLFHKLLGFGLHLKYLTKGIIINWIFFYTVRLSRRFWTPFSPAATLPLPIPTPMGDRRHSWCARNSIHWIDQIWQSHRHISNFPVQVTVQPAPQVKMAILNKDTVFDFRSDSWDITTLLKHFQMHL